jgi:hypothetical protein
MRLACRYVTGSTRIIPSTRYEVDDDGDLVIIIGGGTSEYTNGDGVVNGPLTWHEIWVEEPRDVDVKEASEAFQAGYV